MHAVLEPINLDSESQRISTHNRCRFAKVFYHFGIWTERDSIFIRLFFSRNQVNTNLTKVPDGKKKKNKPNPLSR